MPLSAAADIAEAWQMVEQGYVPPPCEVAPADTRIIS